jgi:hypothetical protein
MRDPQTLAADIAAWQQEKIDAWHRADGTPLEISNEDSSTGEDPFRDLVTEQHRRNVCLWHQEDLARDPEAADSVIADVKRKIDKFNQQRNDLIEKLDIAIMQMLADEGVDFEADLPWNSETPGSMVDRMSIMALKIFHTGVQTRRTDADAAHIEKARTRLAVLRDQRADLGTAFAWLLNDILAGKKRMKFYRQFKMYNDPAWNPAVYGKTGK